MINKVRVTEIKGVPHTLTQTNGKTFRIFARQEIVINEDLISPEFYAEQKNGGIHLSPVPTEKTVTEKSEPIEEKKTKGGNK